MKTQDVIEQLVGTAEGIDEAGDHCFVLYGCAKFDGKDANVDFAEGTVEVLENKEGEDVVIHTYAIKATLEPVTTD